MPKKRNDPRKLNPVMHIFCEGEKTEPNYLKGYLDEFIPGNRSLKVIRIEPTKKNTPMQLVEKAIREKKSSPEGDLFWVVYDRENENKYPGSIHARARVKADNNNVKIALSNICFEVWLLLHFRSSTGPYDSFDDLWKRSPLKKHLPQYDKGDRTIFDSVSGGIPSARKNARKLNKNTKDGADPSWTRPDQWNPYSNVYELLDAIDRFAKPE